MSQSYPHWYASLIARYYALQSFTKITLLFKPRYKLALQSPLLESWSGGKHEPSSSNTAQCNRLQGKFLLALSGYHITTIRKKLRKLPFDNLPCSKYTSPPDFTRTPTSINPFISYPSRFFSYFSPLPHIPRSSQSHKLPPSRSLYVAKKPATDVYTTVAPAPGRQS